MEWSDNAIVLSSRAHGESGAILELLTRDHGRHAGNGSGLLVDLREEHDARAALRRHGTVNGRAHGPTGSDEVDGGALDDHFAETRDPPPATPW